MSEVNYAVMSDQELKQYFLLHREDKRAFRVYLDRLSDHKREIITTVDDSNFDEKIQAAVLQKMKVAKI
jgi:hypothetical protein